MRKNPSPITDFHIVMPSFNQAQFIREAIDSVLAQTGVTRHLYVMDGGSTDGTVEILESYRNQIKWKSEPDRGQTDALNKGIAWIESVRAASQRSSIFSYLNSDDRLEPGALQRVAEEFQVQPERAWLVGDARIISSTGLEIQRAVRAYKSLWRRLYSSTTLQLLNPIPQPATYIRWSAVLEVGAFDDALKYTMDYDYWLRLQQRYGSPVFVWRPLAGFRIHELSKGGSAYTEQFAEELQVLERHCKNPLVRFAHRVHNWAIRTSYRVLKG